MRREKLFQCSAHTEANGFQEHRRHHGRASDGIPGFTIERQKEGHDTRQLGDKECCGSLPRGPGFKVRACDRVWGDS